MTDGKHTPGPWTVAGPSGNIHEAEVIESDSRTIAWTCNSSNEQTMPCDKANARLIAAAPKLLAALQAVKSLPGFEPTEPYGKMVVAAIRKATGESGESKEDLAERLESMGEAIDREGD